MAFDYETVYAGARAELDRLQAAKDQLNDELAKVDNLIEAVCTTLHAIGPIVGELPDWGPVMECVGEAGRNFEVTENVRRIIETVSEPVSAPQIRDLLEEKGWNPGAYSNPLATLHTVLKRLVESGEAKEIYGHEGKLYWRTRRPSTESQTAPPGVSRQDQCAGQAPTQTPRRSKRRQLNAGKEAN